jgi:hypothetical protein
MESSEQVCISALQDYNHHHCGLVIMHSVIKWPVQMMDPCCYVKNIPVLCFDNLVWSTANQPHHRYINKIIILIILIEWIIDCHRAAGLTNVLCVTVSGQCGVLLPGDARSLSPSPSSSSSSSLLIPFLLLLPFLLDAIDPQSSHGFDDDASHCVW